MQIIPLDDQLFEIRDADGRTYACLTLADDHALLTIFDVRRQPILVARVGERDPTILDLRRAGISRLVGIVQDGIPSLTFCDQAGEPQRIFSPEDAPANFHLPTTTPN